MTRRAFAALTPAPGAGEVQWALERMRGREGVSGVVPTGFEAALRIMHPLADGRLWVDVAPEYLGRGGRYTYPYPDDLDAREGDLGNEVVDALVPVLAAATTTPDLCHYGVWIGWGSYTPGAHMAMISTDERVGPLGRLRARRRLAELRRAEEERYQPIYQFVGSCPVAEWWGGRDMFLSDGPIEAVASISDGPEWTDGTIWRRSPQWWWPHDRAWFIGTEIDFAWSYVVGSDAVVASIAEIADIEAVRIDIADPW